MRHRSSVAVVESDRGDVHLVLSPARSIDTHVIRRVSKHTQLSHTRKKKKTGRGACFAVNFSR
jgi:hypothetical protein